MMPTWLIVGASRGIGLEFVRQLLGRGDQVIATVRDPQKASELWSLAGEAPRGACRLLLCDVSSDESITVEQSTTKHHFPRFWELMISDVHQRVICPSRSLHNRLCYPQRGYTQVPQRMCRLTLPYPHAHTSREPPKCMPGKRSYKGTSSDFQSAHSMTSKTTFGQIPLDLLL